MNPRAKGNRLELERQKMFEAAGYLVARAGMVQRCIGKRADGSPRWVQVRADLFGIADFVAATIGASPRLVNVTTLSNASSHRHKIENLEDLERLSGFRLEVHARADRSPWRVWSYIFENWETEAVSGGWSEIPDYLERKR